MRDVCPMNLVDPPCDRHHELVAIPQYHDRRSTRVKKRHELTQCELGHISSVFV